MYEIAKANYLQRIRKNTFLIAFVVIMVFVFIYLPSKNVNYETFDIDGYRGILNGAWIGAIVAVVSSSSLSVYGYFLINDTIKKDEKTKVGEIIGSTSIKNFEYLVGQTLSNFLVLTTLLIFIMVSSIGMFFIRAESTNFNVVQFILPFIVITLPSLLFVSILAVALESLPYTNKWINIVIFACFIFLVMPGATLNNLGNVSFDFFGYSIIITSVTDQVLKINPLVNTKNIVYGFVMPRQYPLVEFLYTGTNFTPIDIAYRIAWMILGIILIIVVSPIFDRFSSKYSFNYLNYIKNRRNITTIPNYEKEHSGLSLVTNHTTKLTRLDSSRIKTNPIDLLLNEIRLLVNQRPKWFIGISAFFIALGFFASNPGLQLIIWSINWILPITILSSIGVKEYEFNTSPLIFSTRKPLFNQFFIPLLARWSLLIFYNLGAVCILLVTGDIDRLVVLFSGSLFLVGLASFCGIFFKTDKLFELLYLFIWLLGPLNAVPQLDFIGVTQSSVAYASWVIFLLIGILTIFCSFVLKIKQIRLN